MRAVRRRAPMRVGQAVDETRKRPGNGQRGSGPGVRFMVAPPGNTGGRRFKRACSEEHALDGMLRKACSRAQRAQDRLGGGLLGRTS